MSLALIFSHTFCTLKSMKKEKTVKAKNIYKTIHNGSLRYVVQIDRKGRRLRRFFTSESLARKFLKEYKDSQEKGLSDFAELSHEQLTDIRTALKALPEGYTLTNCVEIVSKKYVSTRKLKDCLDDFITLKENANLSEVQLRHVKTRIESLRNLKSFDDITADKLFEHLGKIKNRYGKNLAPKTRRHYLSDWREFFNWCETRGYIKETPFKQVHTSDMPKLEDGNPEAASVEAVKEFFAEAEVVCPQFVSIFALTAFGGWRNAEAARLRPKNFDFERKTISLSKDLTKTGENYGNLMPKDKGQANYPDALWEWLEKYPPADKWAEYDKYWYSKIKASKNIPHNGLRHSFATYHMSLHQDSELTKNLMHHHLNSNELWKHYMAGFVKPDIAEEYFEIKPTQI